MGTCLLVVCADLVEAILEIFKKIGLQTASAAAGWRKFIKLRVLGYVEAELCSDRRGDAGTADG